MIVTTAKGLTVRVRQFEKADINRVVGIEEESSLDGDAPLYLELHEEWSQGFLVAEHKGMVIGFIVLVLTPEGEGRIFALAIDTRYRGKGVGRTLLKAAFNTLRKRKIGYVRLEVRLSNHVAQQLYRSTGFMEVGLVPYYYKDGEAAIVMRKVL